MAKRSKVSDDRAKYHGKELERDLGHGHSSRGSDSYRYSDKHSHRNSREYQHSRGYHRLANDEDKYSKETSGNSDRNAERYHSRDKFENSGHRIRGRDRQVNATDHRYNEIDSSRAVSGSRKISSRRDNERVDERERLRGRDDRKIRHRSSSDYRKEYSLIPEDSGGHTKDSFIGRESDGYRLKETQRKEFDEQESQAQKRRYNDKDAKKYDKKYSLHLERNSMESDSFSVYHSREEKSDVYVDKNSNSTEDESSSKRLKLGQSDKCMVACWIFFIVFCPLKLPKLCCI